MLCTCVTSAVGGQAGLAGGLLVVVVEATVSRSVRASRQVVVPAERKTVDTSGPCSNSWPAISPPILASAAALLSTSMNRACLHEPSEPSEKTVPKVSSARVRDAPTVAAKLRFLVTGVFCSPMLASARRTIAAVMLAEAWLTWMGRIEKLISGLGGQRD
ncbi:hypothetical protein BR93DRAFT_927275 [Coniochaeta sp. PMI_546]|nr:hypothetical protein BR93DRAFT_927275 [Coniochaeta sp. PMI_546]